MAVNRIKVESKDSEGAEVIVYATRPTAEETAEAQMVSNKAFKTALIAGAMVRKTLDAELERQGIWDDEKQAKVDKHNKEIKEHLLAIKKGGIKLQEARDLAIKVRMARIEMIQLQSERNEYDAYTAEAQAENAKIDQYMALCIKDEEGKPCFEDVEAYREKSTEPFVIEAANKLVTLIYGVDDGWEAQLPENKFLSKYKFVDEDLRLVKDGHLVTIDGKEINDKFQYVDADGNVTDADGHRIDEDGLPVVEAEPFLDDDGNPIEEEEEVEDDSASDENAE